MNTEDFNLLSGILKERSGLELSQDKLYLLESRLGPIAKKRGLDDLDQLASAVRTKRDEALLNEITEAMTTNESFFFRDTKPFDRFRQMMLPALLEARQATKKIRIWCAACSTGQEPYSLAMCLREEADKLTGWRVEIVATDLSNEVLEKAKTGVYSQFEVQRGLPIQLLVKYFEKIGEMWQIDASIRAMVQYKTHNLLEPAPIGKFDIIFCRNVLIYFDQELKAKVLGDLSNMVPEDGYLLLGGAETVIGLNTRFQPMPGERGVYCLGADGATH